MTADKIENYEFWRREYEARRDDVAERVKYQHEFSIAALRSLMIANGGAILALLTYIGNHNKLNQPEAIKSSMICYGLGLVLGLLTYFGAYMSQGCAMEISAYRGAIAQELMRGGESEQDWQERIAIARRRTGWFIWSAIVLALASLALFGVGCWQALRGII